MVMSVSVDRYCGEGIYVIDWGYGPSIHRCDCAGRDKIRIMNDNPISRSSRELTFASFNSMTLRFVVADIKVRDQRMVRALFEGRA